MRVMRGAPDDAAATNPSSPSVRAVERLVLGERAPREPHRGAEDSSLGDLALAGLAIELDVLAAVFGGRGLDPEDAMELRVATYVATLARRALIAAELHRRLDSATGPPRGGQ